MALTHTITTPDGIEHTAAYVRIDASHNERSLSNPTAVCTLNTYHDNATRQANAEPIQREFGVDLEAMATGLGDDHAAVVAFRTAQDAVVAATYQLVKAANPGKYEDAE